MTVFQKKRGSGGKLSEAEVKIRMKKLRIARHRASCRYERKRKEFEQEQAQIQRNCPHTDYHRESVYEGSCFICNFCDKELVTVPSDPDEIDEEYNDGDHTT